MLSRHVANPKVFHAPLVKYFLRYSKATIDWGLFYPSAKVLQEASEKVPDHMILYTDSDHCGEEKKRSTSGWAVQLYGSWWLADLSYRLLLLRAHAPESTFLHVLATMLL